MEREVAIKILSPKYAHRPEFVERFFAALALAALALGHGLLGKVVAAAQAVGVKRIFSRPRQGRQGDRREESGADGRGNGVFRLVLP